MNPTSYEEYCFLMPEAISIQEIVKTVYFRFVYHHKGHIYEHENKYLRKELDFMKHMSIEIDDNINQARGFVTGGYAEKAVDKLIDTIAVYGIILEENEQ